MHLSLPIRVRGPGLAPSRGAATPVQAIERKDRLRRLAPKSGFVTAEAVKWESRQVGEPHVGLREILRLRRLALVAGVDWL